MVQQNPGEHRPAVSRVRKIAALNDPALQGDDSGFLETTELTEVTDEGLQETTVTRYTYCSGCGKPIRSAEELGGRCMAACQALLCKDCSSVVCADETCRKIICPSHQVRWKGLVYCAEHAKARILFGFCAFFIIAAIVAVGAVLLWNMAS